MLCNYLFVKGDDKQPLRTLKLDFAARNRTPAAAAKPAKTRVAAKRREPHPAATLSTAEALARAQVA